MKSTNQNGTVKASTSETEIARLRERLGNDKIRQRERGGAKGQTLTPGQEMNFRM